MSRLPTMIVRRLLKSCATPPVSWPTASIFCDWANCSRACPSSRRASRRILSVRLRSAMSAAKVTVGIAMPIMTRRSRVDDSSRMLCANGPPPKIAPQTTKPESMSATVAVSRGPRRNAAHSSGRMAKTPNGALFGMSAISGLNTTTPKALATAKIALGSNTDIDTCTDACADGRGKHGDQYELGDPGRSSKGVATLRPAIDQKATRECFECIACRGRGDGVAWTGRQCVHEKRRREDRRYDPISSEQDGCERKSSRRPNRCRARVDRGEIETESRGEKIDGADSRELDDVCQGAKQGGAIREVVEVDRRHCLAPPTMSRPELNAYRADTPMTNFGLFRDFACRFPYFCRLRSCFRCGPHRRLRRSVSTVCFHCARLSTMIFVDLAAA